MTVRIDEATCAQVAKFLPRAIQKAFETYYAYIDSDWINNPAKDDKRTRDKMFTDHSAACKAAIAHIELLLKLGTAAGLETRADHTALAFIKMGAASAYENRAKDAPEDTPEDGEE